MMLSRVGPLLLAVIVTAAPVSLTVCEVLCATRSSARNSTHADASGHSCHDTQPTGSSGAVSGQGHVCGHRDELPVSFGVMSNHVVPGPTQTPLVSLRVSSVEIHRFTPFEATSPPGHPASRTPLRI